MAPETRGFLPACRMANEADEARLWDVLMELERDNGMGLPRSDLKVWQAIEQCCRCQGGVAGVIEGPKGRIDATIGIVLAQVWYSDTWFPKEIWFFVRPEARQGGKLADALFAFAEDHRSYLSEQIGRPLPLFTGPTSFKRLDAKMRWWGRHAKLVGGIFMLGEV